ncbi:MAG: hypothetical protein WBR56_11285 [Sedimenticolaceae bacterium]
MIIESPCPSRQHRDKCTLCHTGLAQSVGGVSASVMLTAADQLWLGRAYIDQ